MMNKWVLGARPRTLPAAIAPVLVATALARSEWSIQPALLALFVSLTLQIGVNYANDYSDGVRGTDTDRVGPTRLTASGLATPRAVKTAAFICFALSALAGFILALQTSWWLIAVGFIAILAAWGYTGGKSPYGYRGLGEVSVFLFFGVVATVGSYFVQTQRLTLQAFIASVPVGALACALLAINNLRDRAKDEVVGKRTLAVRLGDKGARALFITLIFSAHLFALATLRPWSALTFFALPLTVKLAREVSSGVQGMELIPVLAKTGRLQLVFAILFSLGLVL